MNKTSNSNGWMVKWVVGVMLTMIAILIGVSGCAWRVAEASRAKTNVLDRDFYAHCQRQEARDIHIRENLTEIRRHLEKIETKLEKP